jgi:hypothetical protein
VQPTETDFFNFHPAFAHGLQAALLERLAVAVAIEQSEAAVLWAWGEQGDEKAHGRISVSGDLHAA